MNLNDEYKAEIKKMVDRVLAKMQPFDVDEANRKYEESKRFYE